MKMEILAGIVAFIIAAGIILLQLGFIALIVITIIWAAKFALGM